MLKKLMKITEIKTLIEVGNFKSSPEMKQIENHLRQAIYAIQHPQGTGQFILHPKKKGNGVKPIKDAFVSTLEDLGWEPEARLPIAVYKKPGPLDAVIKLPNGQHYAVEWETGNISSSHRALNKIVVGLQTGQLIGGTLVLPSGNMYPYLTDRVGNYPELEPYFSVWESMDIKEGVLTIIVVEQDGVSLDVPRIQKGTDGRALR